jgi:hypothetical protein
MLALVRKIFRVKLHLHYMYYLVFLKCCNAFTELKIVWTVFKN